MIFKKAEKELRDLLFGAGAHFVNMQYSKNMGKTSGTRVVCEVIFCLDFAKDAYDIRAVTWDDVVAEVRVFLNRAKEPSPGDVPEE